MGQLYAGMATRVRKRNAQSGLRRVVMAVPRGCAGIQRRELTRARNYDGPEECLGALSLSASVNSTPSLRCLVSTRRENNTRVKTLLLGFVTRFDPSRMQMQSCMRRRNARRYFNCARRAMTDESRGSCNITRFTSPSYFMRVTRAYLSERLGRYEYLLLICTKISRLGTVQDS